MLADAGPSVKTAFDYEIYMKECHVLWGQGMYTNNVFQKRCHQTHFGNFVKPQQIFSQMWLRYVWLYAMTNSSVCLSVCRLWRACTLLRGFNISGIFLHHIVAWPSGNLPTKNHKDVQMDHPQRGVKCKGQEKVAISDQYLAIARKRLKIDGYMLRCFWPALNPLSIHVTFTAIVPGAYPGEAKMCISPPISRYLFITDEAIYSFIIYHWTLCYYIEFSDLYSWRINK